MSTLALPSPTAPLYNGCRVVSMPSSHTGSLEIPKLAMPPPTSGPLHMLCALCLVPFSSLTPTPDLPSCPSGSPPFSSSKSQCQGRPFREPLLMPRCRQGSWSHEPLPLPPSLGSVYSCLIHVLCVAVNGATATVFVLCTKEPGPGPLTKEILSALCLPSCV